VAFNSYVFVAFFVAVLAIRRVTRGQTAQLWLLLVASAIFYASWSAPYLALLAVSIVVDYALGRALGAATRGRKLLLAVSLVVNLGLLAIFKYGDFVVANVNALFAALGVARALPEPGLTLPLGISFYTFMTLSYTIDVYRGVCPVEKSLLRYAVFLLFFPHLIMGPILRANEFLPQLANPDPAAHRPWFAVQRIAVGFAKKLLLADLLARFVEPIFRDAGAFDGAAALLAAYAYAFQVYFDFSAYADIAIGCASLLGYRLPENFERPLLAASLRDLWRRWHRTLSNWLRDYVYLPLGGGRGGRLMTARNLAITMLVGGLWHGAAWHYVAWGGLNAALLLVERAWAGPARAWRVLVTFQLFALALVVFRAPSLAAAGVMLAHIARLPSSGAVRALIAVAAAPLALTGYARVSSLVRGWQDAAPRTDWQAVGWGCALALVVTVLAALASPPAEFIYFHF
jgi:D-alanyl-lipoteichoic acid acyltransferase DltB (MBOAT superfamily)